MKIAMSVGHGKLVRGASASPRPPYLDEVDEAVRVVEKVAAYWRDSGVGVETFFDQTSTSVNQNLSTIVNWHNARARDYDVSCHFNAYQVTSKPMGTEVLYVTQQQLASDTSAAIARAGGFINRGPKKRTDLYFLNNTSKPAILLEVCFVDSSADGDLYRRNFDAICQAIAEVVGQVTIGEPPTEPPTEPEPEPPPPDDVTAHVDINIRTTGKVVVTINGEDFMVSEPGPEEPATPLIKPNHQNIIATVFGGADDPNDSAYAPYDRITDTEKSVALPYKFAEPRPKVRVFNAENELSVLCEIRDVGPWLTDDAAYVLGDHRPLAEPAGTTIPRGPNEGETSNGAGLDLTPAAAEAIRLQGKGTVHWMFDQEELIA